jgi:ATP-dependent helicase/nuclease subunit A
MVIDLSSNFRSRGPLLEVVNCLFERLMVRDAVDIQYDDSHRLKAGATYPAESASRCFSGAPVELHLLSPPQAIALHDDATDSDLDRTEREAAFIAQRITQLIQSGINVTEKAADA